MNFAQVDTFLNGLERRGKPGTDCAVYLDGRLIHRHMRGLADVENGVPISEDTVYRMFSMTKPVTCVAMLQLYEQGRFLLTDPVSLYLPEFAHMQVAHHLPAEAAPITMRQLFTMTSGLTYNLETEELKALYRDQPDYTTRDFVRAVARAPLAFQPGDTWLYSLAHDVLAACVEALTGMRFAAYVQKHIFEPLGMREAWFHVPQEQLARCCVRYGYDAAAGALVREPGDTPAQRYNPYQRSVNHDSGGAGLSATVNDYAKFARMLTRLGVGDDGTRVIGAQTLNLMRENQLTPRQMEGFNWIQFAGYGYGLGVRTLMNRAAAGALGAAGEYGWAGAAGTYLLADPEKKLTIVYAQQTAPSDEVCIQPRLRNMIYAALEY